MMNLNNTVGMQKIMLFIAMCVVGFQGLDAQVYNSPFSRYGLGDLTDPNFVMTRGMGGLGSSYTDFTTINPVNPASYSTLTLTSYDVSFYAEYAGVNDPNTSEDRWQGNLDYLALGFPLRNYKNELLDPKKRKFKLGMAFYLKPYSRVSYNVTTLEEQTESANIIRNFSGTGGTYQIGWGNSIKYKSLSAGANLGFLYGKLDNTQQIALQNEPASVTDFISNNYSVRGFMYDLGLIYELILNKKELENVGTAKKKKLNFGLRGSPAINFTTDGNYSHIGRNPSLGIVDTLEYNQTITGTGKLPLTIGGGVTYYSGQQLTLGVDGEFKRWSSFENTIRPTQSFVDSYKVSIGGKYRPDERGFGTFLERTSYTGGLYYEKDPRVVSGQELTNYGIRVGAVLPFFYQQNYSSVNLSLDFGRRGNPDVLQENFVRMSVGMNFNDDSWFIQRKYN